MPRNENIAQLMTRLSMTSLFKKNNYFEDNCLLEFSLLISFIRMCYYRFAYHSLVGALVFLYVEILVLKYKENIIQFIMLEMSFYIQPMMSPFSGWGWRKKGEVQGVEALDEHGEVGNAGGILADTGSGVGVVGDTGGGVADSGGAGGTGGGVAGVGAGGAGVGAGGAGGAHGKSD